MPQTFVIDQARTFDKVILLSVEEKLAFGTDKQDTTKDGTPKWEAQVAAGFRAFGRTQNEVLRVGVASTSNPAEAIQPYSPVELLGFQVGVMEKTGRDGQVIGFQVWYRADEIRSIADTRPARGAGKGSADGEAA